MLNGLLIKLFDKIQKTTERQARRQDSVTGGGGAEINFGGHEKFIYVNSRGARGRKKFIPVWIK